MKITSIYKIITDKQLRTSRKQTKTNKQIDKTDNQIDRQTNRQYRTNISSSKIQIQNSES